MKKVVDEKLKQFIEDNFDVATLRKAGVFRKGLRLTDYEAIAERICFIFSYKSIYEYRAPEIKAYPDADCAYGKFPDEVSASGELISGGGFHISGIGKFAEDFICPICECPQQARETDRIVFTQKCKGCKRQLTIVQPPFGGEMSVTEKKIGK